jgi:hypothetical protein
MAITKQKKVEIVDEVTKKLLTLFKFPFKTNDND